MRNLTKPQGTSGTADSTPAKPKASRFCPVAALDLLRGFMLIVSLSFRHVAFKPIEFFPPISARDWITDISWVAECIDDTERSHFSTIEAYFERAYGEQSGPRVRRVMAAIRYFMEHRDDFNEGALGIDGHDGFVPGTLLLKSLLVIFNGASEDQLGLDWPVETVKDIARALERAKGD